MSIAALMTNTVLAAATATAASRTPIVPRGSSRMAVRGFRASHSRSTMRLNPMAAKRALVNASTIHATARRVTGATYDASVAPTSANGSANSVCGSLTKLA